MQIKGKALCQTQLLLSKFEIFERDIVLPDFVQRQGLKIFKMKLYFLF